MDHTSIVGVGLGAGVGLEEVADRVAFLPNFANVVVVDGGDQLALIDTGSFFTAPRVFAEVRRWRQARLGTAIYTHGHVDHAMGVGPFDDEARTAAGRARR
jgi:glyoxylase-like metal-dependent hydrolase (beta-lactamase superfamily II)